MKMSMKMRLGLTLILSLLFATNPAFAESTGSTSSHRDNTALFPPKQPQKNLTQRPEKASLLAPEAFEAVPKAGVTLKWKETAGATVYHLQVATDPNFKWLKVNEPLFKGTSYELKDLEASKHYFWRVAGVNPGLDAGYIKGDFAKSTFETSP